MILERVKNLFFSQAIHKREFVRNMSINEVFPRFINRIKPTEAELERARSRRNYLEKRVLGLDVGVFEIRNSGSYAKATAIHPLNDIDVVFYIDTRKYPYKNLGRILHRIARELRPSYPNNPIEVGNRSIKLNYADGFSIDIVPALSDNRKVEGAEIIDRETGAWIRTSIPKYVDFANRMNRVNGRYKNLVRMFKIWKDLRQRKYPSFFLSLLVAHTVKKGLPKGWEQSVFSVLETIQETKLNSPIYFTDFYQQIKVVSNDPVIVVDPSNPRNNVAKFMDAKIKQSFLNAWNNSYNQARKAINSTTKKDKIFYWTEVFGERFPSR